jgi:hypothetical protein
MEFSWGPCLVGFLYFSLSERLEILVVLNVWFGVVSSLSYNLSRKRIMINMINENTLSTLGTFVGAVT